MLDAIKLRVLQGDPIIHDVRNANLPQLFRGLPQITTDSCPESCSKCKDSCPANAIELNPTSIDLGKCIFCPQCESACPDNHIHFTNDYKIGSNKRENLFVTAETKSIKPSIAEQKILSYFGKSLKLRQVSAGGCNGCELELNATSNVNFDMGRYGIEFVASPRHADGIVITGPITKNMSRATQICLEAVPNPRIIILCGTCAISGGIFSESHQVQRDFMKENHIDLFIPGCPPHPLTFINCLLDWLGRK